MHRGRFEGTAGPRRRRATSIGFRVEPQAVGRARERVRRHRGARVRRHGELGHLGSGLERHGSGAGDESCEGRDAHQAAFDSTVLSVLVLSTQLAASKALRCNAVSTPLWTAGGCAKRRLRVRRRATACSLTAKMQASQPSVRAPRRLQLSFVHPLSPVEGRRLRPPRHGETLAKKRALSFLNSFGLFHPR